MVLKSGHKRRRRQGEGVGEGGLQTSRRRANETTRRPGRRVNVEEKEANKKDAAVTTRGTHQPDGETSARK